MVLRRAAESGQYNIIQQRREEYNVKKRDEIARLADKNRRSMNAEIIARLQDVLEKERVVYRIEDAGKAYGKQAIADDLCRLVKTLSEEKQRAILLLLKDD